MSPEPRWTEVMDLSEATLDKPNEIKINAEDLLLFFAEGSWYAIQRSCPHMEADLKDARLIGETVKCSRHGMIFNLKNGRGVNCHPFKAKVYEVKVDEGKIKVFI
jgi:3-phenylpropionate/trans-cinnamate dioxygenase ferredoxin subunit